MGDGYLTIYEDPSVAFTVANKLLKWKKDCAKRKDIPNFNFRISLDCGPTTPTQSQDRMGMAINRASRIEKTQQHELEQPGDTEIHTTNRCLLTGDMYKSLSTADKGLCLYVGAKSIKGFGAELHNLYQMSL